MRAKNKASENKAAAKEAGRRESDQIVYRELGTLAQAVVDIKELINTKFDALEKTVGGLDKKVDATSTDLSNLRDNHVKGLTSDVANLRVETNQKLNRMEKLIIISLTLITITAFGVALGRAFDLDIIGILKMLFM